MLEQRFNKTRLNIAASEISRDESGLIRIKISENRTINPQDMQVITVAIGYLSTGGPKPVVVELGDGSEITKQAAKTLLNSGVCHHMQCLAFVSSSFGHYIRMSMSMLMQKPVTPIKVFRQSGTALRWLEEKVQAYTSASGRAYEVEAASSVPYSLNF